MGPGPIYTYLYEYQSLKMGPGPIYTHLYEYQGFSMIRPNHHVYIEKVACLLFQPVCIYSLHLDNISVICYIFDRVRSS